MQKIENYITQINNRIQLKHKELSFENDLNGRENLKRELNVSQLKKQIAVLQKKIKQIQD